MIETKFEEIWKVALKPYLEKELSLNSSFQPVDRTENYSKARRDIESQYNTLKEAVKREFMKDWENLLDRHKVPACIYIAIVSNPLIKVFAGTKEKDMLVNAGLAFHVAIAVLSSFMAHSADADYSQFLENNSLLFPKSKNLDSNESYLIQTVKSLCYAQKRKELNVLKLANIFYLLEIYTDLAYRTNIKKPQVEALAGVKFNKTK